MAAVYPGALANLANPAGTDYMSDPAKLHSDQHIKANDEIDAIEAELGINPRGSSATVAARLTAIESAATTSAVPAGSMFPHAGFVAPSGYILAAGQTLSRTTNATLFTAITATYTAGVTNASTNVTGTFPAVATTNLVGMPVSGTNIQSGTTITAQTTTSLTLSLAATGTASIQLLVAPWGVGDGSTTFNAPDMRGRNAMGRDDMNGTDAARISTANRIGATAGAETSTLVAANMPAHNHTIDHGHADTIAVDAYAGNSGNDTPDHTHITPDHGHYSYTYGGAGTHAHTMNVADVSKTGSGTFAKGYSAGNTATDAAGGHEHAVGTAGAGNIQSWGVYDNRHQHSINHSHTKSGGVTALSGGVSGTTAAATGFNNLDPHAVSNWIVKT